MPICSLTYKNQTTFHSLLATGAARMGNNAAHDLRANKREVHLTEVKFYEHTRPKHQLEASRKQHETMQALESQMSHSTRSLLVLEVPIESISTSYSLCHLKELGLDSQEIQKTALKLHAHSVHYAKNELLSRPWSGAGAGQPPSRSPLVIFSIGGRLHANVSPFP